MDMADEAPEVLQSLVEVSVVHLFEASLVRDQQVDLMFNLPANFFADRDPACRKDVITKNLNPAPHSC